MVVKNELLYLIRPPPKPGYSIHNPKGIALHTQLHFGLGKLNLGKFRHNFRDTLNQLRPQSDDFEDTGHFLLQFDSFNAHIKDLLNILNAT